jgi:succinyl-diaminopimelate desuccinylase
MKELLKELIQAETTVEKGELSAAEIISAQFGKSGIDCSIENWDQNRANVIARTDSSGERPALLFVCHLDVVGPGESKWKYPPFAASEQNGRIYGRGAADMKGGIAAVVAAIQQTVESGISLQGDIIFVGAAGEETDSCGVKRFIKNSNSLEKLAGIVIPEPTDFDVVTAHRGMMWLKITTKGKAAHSSKPELGLNAINSMRAFLDELNKYEFKVQPHKLLGNCSMSVNTISGGEAMNVVPDECTVGIDIRTLPKQDHQAIISDIEQMFALIRSRDADFDAKVSMLRSVDAMETDPNCIFVQDFCSVVGASEAKAVGFTTDAPHLLGLGTPIVIFGPGKGELCHKADEYIEIADLKKAFEYYRSIISHFLM